MSCSRSRSRNQNQKRDSNLLLLQGRQLISLATRVLPHQMEDMQRTGQPLAGRSYSPIWGVPKEVFPVRMWCMVHPSCPYSFYRMELCHGDPSQGLGGCKIGLPAVIFPTLTKKEASVCCSLFMTPSKLLPRGLNMCM